MLAVYLFSKGSKNISSEIVSPLTGLMLPNCVPVPSVGSGSGGKPVVFNCGNSGRPKLLNGFGILGNSPSKGSVSKTFLNLSIVDSAPSYGLAVPNFSPIS